MINAKTTAAALTALIEKRLKADPSADVFELEKAREIAEDRIARETAEYFWMQRADDDTLDLY